MAGKILGSVLIVAACFAMGYRLSIREKLRLDELILCKECVLKILSEIEHNRATFTEALINSVDIDKYDIFNAIYVAVKNNNSVKTAWKYAFEENADDCYMNKEDIERLSAVGEGFGSGDIELQKSYVNNAVEYINSKEEEINKRLEKDKRVYRSVSVSIGLFIVIMLL